MSKNTNIVRISTGLSTKFFKYWFDFLEPFHKLTGREIDVIACFVKQRYLLSKVIKDEDILDKVVMSEDTKKKIREECNITLSHFQVVMSKLKKNKLIVVVENPTKFVIKIDKYAKNKQMANIL